MAMTRNSDLSLHEALNRLLADSFALYIKTKNFHWHVSGPHFREYHLLLDEQATQIFATTDAIAERVRKTGGTTIKSVGEIARLQRIKDSDGDLAAEAMLAELKADNETLAEMIKDAKKLADEAGDNATSAMADDWTDGAERRAWFLAETLAAG
jgi:starvation-inducible DNA-binding protein